MSDELTDAEYEEMKQNQAALRDALKGPRADEVKQAFIDFIRFPPKSGELD